MTKVTVFDEVAIIDFDGCTLSMVLQEVQHLIESYGKNAKVSKEQYRYEDGHYFALMKPREETDEEYEKRISAINSFKIRQEQIEKETLARLKAKWESNEQNQSQ